MKIKLLVLALLMIPFVSQAVSIPKGFEVIQGELYDYGFYYMYDTETVESVAKKFGVPTANVLTDIEGSTGGDWKQIMVVVRGTPRATQVQIETPKKEKKPILRPNEKVKTVPTVASTTDTTDKIETLEKENEQLKTQIALLQQLISLLKTLAGLKQ